MLTIDFHCVPRSLILIPLLANSFVYPFLLICLFFCFLLPIWVYVYLYPLKNLALFFCGLINIKWGEYSDTPTIKKNKFKNAATKCTGLII